MSALPNSQTAAGSGTADTVMLSMPAALFGLLLARLSLNPNTR
jgi:hypothetical protein